MAHLFKKSNLSDFCEATIPPQPTTALHRGSKVRIQSSLNFTQNSRKERKRMREIVYKNQTCLTFVKLQSHHNPLQLYRFTAIAPFENLLVKICFISALGLMTFLLLLFLFPSIWRCFLAELMA